MNGTGGGCKILALAEVKWGGGQWKLKDTCSYGAQCRTFLYFVFGYVCSPTHPPTYSFLNRIIWSLTFSDTPLAARLKWCVDPARARPQGCWIHQHIHANVSLQKCGRFGNWQPHFCVPFGVWINAVWRSVVN